MSSSAGDEPTLLFLHIPKTGGTTLSRILREQYAPDRIFHVRDPEQRSAPRHSPHHGSLADFARLPEAQRGRFDCVLGHFAFGVHELIPRPSRYLTLLRDPVARCVSLHRQYVHHHVAAGTFTLADAPSLATYLSRTPAVLRGQPVHLLAGREHAERDADEADLETARAHLRHPGTIVGTLERFDETMVVAARAFGWRPSNYGIENRTSRYALATPPAALARIRAADRLERRLYEQADAQLREAIAAYGPGFERDLARLRRRNAAERLGRGATRLRERVRSGVRAFMDRAARP